MNEEEIKIGKKSWIPLETLVSAIVIACALTAIVIRGEVRGNQNADDLKDLKKAHAIEFHALKMQQAKDINDLRIQIGTYAETTKSRLDSIQTTMDELLFQRRLDVALLDEKTATAMRDRWSLGCMSDHDKWWLKELQRLFAIISEVIGVDVSIHADRLPPLKKIQSDNGF